MERYPIFASTTNLQQERHEIGDLLSEAKALHERMSQLFSSRQSIVSPLPSSRHSDDRGGMTSSRSLEDLLQRGRALDERVQRLRFELPSLRPFEQFRRNEEIEWNDESPMEVRENGDTNDENVDKNFKETLKSRSLSSLACRTIKDELMKPTVRPIPRYEPGLPAYKHDPVRRYELYKQEWAKFPAPGENKHSALRWKIREYMLRIDLPTDLNTKQRFPM